MFLDIPGGEKTIKVSRYHEIAEAIRRGCEMVPIQAYRAYFHRDDLGEIWATCALAAAFMGGFELSSYDKVRCPVVFCPRKVEHFLVSTIEHLNDDHRWSRERIADWIDTL